MYTLEPANNHLNNSWAYCWGTVRVYFYLSDDMQSFVWPLGVVKLAYGDWALFGVIRIVSNSGFEDVL